VRRCREGRRSPAISGPDLEGAEDAREACGGDLSCFAAPFNCRSMSDADNTDAISLAEPKRPLVLVVDDDEAIREALCDLLDDAGFATVGARHGLEALKVLAASMSAPTFILLDLMMPVMDGWAFCDNREKSPTLSEIPVIAISAVEVAESDRPAGIDAFLAKPIDMDSFARLAHRMARRRKSRARRVRFLH
jgi:CheY-like chemotaxis protein